MVPRQVLTFSGSLAERPRLTLTAAVRNEEDVIASFVRFHAAQGVDQFIIADWASSDSTPDQLAALSREHSILFSTLPADHEAAPRFLPDLHGEVVSALAHRAWEIGASWVINADADEFWMPRTGVSLAETCEAVPPHVGFVLGGLRHFFPAPVETLTFRPDAQVFWETGTGYGFYGHSYLPKVAHRAAPSVRITTGNHAVQYDAAVHVSGLWLVDVLHFPIRSRAQLNARLDNPVYQTSKWKRLRAMRDNGELDAYYDQLSDIDSLHARLEEGAVAIDTRLADALGLPHTIDSAMCNGEGARRGVAVREITFAHQILHQEFKRERHARKAQAQRPRTLRGRLARRVLRAFGVVRPSAGSRPVPNWRTT